MWNEEKKKHQKQVMWCEAVNSFTQQIDLITAWGEAAT